MGSTVVKEFARPGSREAGSDALEDLAETLLRTFPISERAAIIRSIAYLQPDQSFGAGTRLAAVKLANDINGIVTAIDDKLAGRGDSSLPVIIIEDMPAVAKARKLMEIASTVAPQPLLEAGVPQLVEKVEKNG